MSRPLPIPASNPETFTVDGVTYTNPFAENEGCDCG